MLWRLLQSLDQHQSYPQLGTWMDEGPSLLFRFLLSYRNTTAEDSVQAGGKRLTSTHVPYVQLFHPHWILSSSDNPHLIPAISLHHQYKGQRVSPPHQPQPRSCLDQGCICPQGFIDGMLLGEDMADDAWERRKHFGSFGLNERTWQRSLAVEAPWKCDSKPQCTLPIFAWKCQILTL